MAEDKARSRLCCLHLLRDLCLLLGRIVLAVLGSALRGVFPRAKKPLKDEVVLVTGAGHGLGRQLAMRCAQLEAIVVLWDIDEKSILNVETEIRAAGGRAHAYCCDVSSADSVRSVGRRVQEDVGDVTVLVNNAGLLQNRPFADLDPKGIKRTFEVNILAHFWTIKFFLPRMLELDKGHIVAISSMAGFVGWLYMADYCASKFAIIGLMESIEEELRIMGKGESVHCTTACPVTIDTGLNHTPTTRLPWLVPILSAEFAAADIVSAVQRNERIVTIPRRVMCPLLVQRLFPRRVTQLILDFLEYNVEPNRPAS